MEHLSSDMEQQQNPEQQIQWRRDKVQELCSKGYSQTEISQVLQVGLVSTFNYYVKLVARLLLLIGLNFASIRATNFHPFLALLCVGLHSKEE
jgi:hypothetical protein